MAAPETPVPVRTLLHETCVETPGAPLIRWCADLTWRCSGCGYRWAEWLVIETPSLETLGLRWDDVPGDRFDAAHEVVRTVAGENRPYVLRLRGNHWLQVGGRSAGRVPVEIHDESHQEARPRPRPNHLNCRCLTVGDLTRMMQGEMATRVTRSFADRLASQESEELRRQYLAEIEAWPAGRRSAAADLHAWLLERTQGARADDVVDAMTWATFHRGADVAGASPAQPARECQTIADACRAGAVTAETAARAIEYLGGHPGDYLPGAARGSSPPDHHGHEGPPAEGDVHADRRLTNISIAWFQDHDHGGSPIRPPIGPRPDWLESDSGPRGNAHEAPRVRPTRRLLEPQGFADVAPVAHESDTDRVLSSIDAALEEFAKGGIEEDPE